MRTRRPALDHTEAVARRLAALSAELEAERAAQAMTLDDVGDADVRAADYPGDHAAEHPAEHPYERGVERTVVRPAVPSSAIRDAFAQYDPETAPGSAPGSAPGNALGNGSGNDEPHVPGRHAARRGARFWSLDDDSTQRWGPGQVGVVLGGVVLALAVTCVWLVFGTTQEVVTPVAARVESSPAAAPATASGAATAGSAPATSVAPAPGAVPGVAPGTAPGAVAGTVTGPVAEVVVDVAGQVRRPGLVVLPSGSRVADAVERAGGARKGVDLSGINLARVLTDGEQILVGAGASAGSSPGPAPGTPSAGSGAAPGAPVSLNSADEALLDTLPGVGPVTAAAIIAWRTQHGGFTDVRELLEVKGIGEATLAELLPHVTL